MTAVKKKPEFYSDWSPLKKAWHALWERPCGNQKDAIELNKELILKIIDNKAAKVRKLGTVAADSCKK